MGLRICMVAACPFPARRGTPLRVERLAEALAERDHEVEVVTYDLAEAPAPQSVRVTRNRRGERRRRMPPGPNLEKLLLLDPLLARKLRQRLRSGAFDIVHAHHFEGTIVARAAGHGFALPIVYDAHTTLAPELPQYFPGLLRPLMERIGRALDRRLPRLADHICTVTPDIRERLLSAHGFDPARVSVVPNGVEIERFTPFAPGGGTAPRVIYTGTLAPYQGMEELLQAFALALRTRSDLQLRLSVSSPPEPWLQRARALGIAHAVEALEDDFDLLPGRLADAAVAVLPRQSCDGIPQKLLNYMAAGTPTVAFAGSAKTLCDEDTGLVVANGDVAGFAAAIVRLVDDPDLRLRLGSAARAYVLANHTWAGAAALAEDVYARLIRARRDIEAEPGWAQPEHRQAAPGEQDAPHRRA